MLQLRRKSQYKCRSLIFSPLLPSHLKRQQMPQESSVGGEDTLSFQRCKCVQNVTTDVNPSMGLEPRTPRVRSLLCAPNKASR